MCISLQGAAQMNKESMAFRLKIMCLVYWLGVTNRRGGLHLGPHHLQLVQLILVKQLVRMVPQWLELIIMKTNLIGLIASNGSYMNQLGASPLQLSHLN